MPPKKAFYSSIDDGKRRKGDACISDEQYSRLKNVWNTLNFKAFKDFYNHDFKKDVLLLANVSEKFIDKLTVNPHFILPECQGTPFCEISRLLPARSSLTFRHYRV